VVIPDTIVGLSVTAIGYGAFSQRTNLTSVTIPNSVTFIEADAFYRCTSLTSVTIPNSVTSLGHHAFSWCISLTNVAIGSRVTSIEWRTFGSCTSLTSVTIPNSVTSIGVAAFSGCTGLTNVMIPNSVTSLGSGAFGSCTSLTAISVETNNPAYNSVSGVLFDKSQTTLIEYPGGKGGSYSIPNRVTSIGGWAFYGCSSLTNVTIPNSVTYIGESAFSGCTNLARVYFEGNAPSLGADVFFSDNKATAYYLPGTTGWGSTYGGIPTAIWSLPYPLILNSSLGVRSNQFGFTVSWATNASVVVEASADLNNPKWSPVQSNVLNNGVVNFTDPEWNKNPSRFYRVRSE
jgi:hypothetical protein